MFELNGTSVTLQIDKWIYGAGVPANCPNVESKEFARVEEQVKAWQSGTAAKELKIDEWTSHHWLHFLRKLNDPISQEKMAELDTAFRFSNTGNSEILNAWLMRAISNKYEPAYPTLERFLTSMGRRRFLRPLYLELAKTPEGLEMAREIYKKARPTYHSVSYNTVDEILKWKSE